MQPFPYFEILKRAYELTIRNLWLWIFGLFVGGTASINFGWIRYFFPGPKNIEFQKVEQEWRQILEWFSAHPQVFAAVAGAIVILALVLIIFAGLSRGAVIWAARELSEHRETFFWRSLKESRKYFWQIIGLQIVVTVTFGIFFSIILAPIAYLFSVGAVGRGVVLSLLGLLIFVPGSIVFGFLHLYGPIFIVLYQARISRAIHLSFNLVRVKLKESIILSAFLIGLSLVFMFLAIFSIILFSLPVAVLILVLFYLKLGTAATILLVGTAIIGFIYLLVLTAGFAIFQNIVWVLAVSEMVKTQKLPEEAKAYAVEPA
ncbi:MAG: hypothetical protein HY396_00885 [Candidatus Doudnabacteria bacterium]|nr:hypothetical protein [Candidatus Doudnabacteria bacterium]